MQRARSCFENIYIYLFISMCFSFASSSCYWSNVSNEIMDFVVKTNTLASHWSHKLYIYIYRYIVEGYLIAFVRAISSYYVGITENEKERERRKNVLNLLRLSFVRSYFSLRTRVVDFVDPTPDHAIHFVCALSPCVLF